MSNRIHDEIQRLLELPRIDIQPKEHAAIVRKALAKRFPDMKFQVRTQLFSGGEAVRVWHREAVDKEMKKCIAEFVEQFEGYRSDLTECSYNVGFEYEGQRYRGAKFCTYHGQIQP